MKRLHTGYCNELLKVVRPTTGLKVSFDAVLFVEEGLWDVLTRVRFGRPLGSSHL